MLPLAVASPPAVVQDELEKVDAVTAESVASEPTQAEEAEQAEQLAEIVLVCTSLGGTKQHFFQSKLAQHILDCKGVVYYLVDANRETSAARELKDRILFDQWSAEGVLKCEYINDRKSVVLPQLLIDGVSVGETKAMQDLEDDGDLDYIIARMVCPACFAEKDQNLDQCPHCKVQYRSLIPPEYQDGLDIQRLIQGVSYDPEEVGDF
ncbi:hypothetical protein BgAZ_403390 [Babesia gibsoni]|uniref:Uncharacterized protein n=1 Tax=Babesia gibsoni TaxID=33632 RepID=A0AAD8PD40_BABGI|nr:hypothetical protein BgAZ_403390 [Babesia gibsoni]